MSRRYDVVVIGAGPNGLVAAGLLARRGRHVLLLERREVVGGLAAVEEFHPGYRAPGPLQDTTTLRPAVVRELELERHGFRWNRRPPARIGLGAPGDALRLAGDPERAARAIAERDPRDAERYREFHAFLRGAEPVVGDHLDRPAPDPVDPFSERPLALLRRGLRLRRRGADGMIELLRVPPLSVHDWLGEWFRDGLLRALLALPACSGAFLGPRSPGSAANLLLHAAAAGRGAAGGVPMLLGALERAARQAGVEIRTGAPVERIRTDADGVGGVRLAGGEEIDGRVVAASCDPRQLFLRLLPPGATAPRLAERIRGFRARGTTARLVLGLSGPPPFVASADDANEPVEYAGVAEHPDRIERAFDAVKYRRFSDDPVLEVHVPTVADPSLAPPGCHVLNVLVHFAPRERQPAWDGAARNELADRAIAGLERSAGALPDVVARRLDSPDEIEARYGVSGGQLHHGEHALDQLLARPAPECAGHATPIPGLFLCGSGSHPGGGLTGAPGRLGARAILNAH